MDSSLLQSEFSEPLLRTLAQTDTSLWCFVPAGASRPACESQEWRRQFACSASDAGERPDSQADEQWRDLLNNGKPYGRMMFHGVSWLVQVTMVPDGTGQETGRLIRLQHEESAQPSPELQSAVEEARRLLASLSPRESEVLELVYEGLTNKAIAARSHISQKTVEKHRGRISRKLQTASLAELVRLVATARMSEESAWQKPEERIRHTIID